MKLVCCTTLQCSVHCKVFFHCLVQYHTVWHVILASTLYVAVLMSNLRFPSKLCWAKPSAKCHQVRARALWRAGWTRADAEEPQVGWFGRRRRIPDQPSTHPNLTLASRVPKSPKRTSKFVKPGGEKGSWNEQKHL